ncbi:MAG: HEAT repeat domain-containing protein, partial [Acidobacteriota bacterium]
MHRVFVIPLALLLGSLPDESALLSHYEKGMELWRAGKAGEALPHLMTATQDPELSFYAARQVALMGKYALPVLHRGLWHPEETIQRQSAIVLGWIGEPASVEPLLLRLKHANAPVEVEYALRKIGGLAGAQLLGLLEPGDLSNAALLDRKVSGVVRLARALRLPIDPVPLLNVVDALETVKASELAEQPLGHLASARLGLLRFLAERKVSKAAAPLVRAFVPEAEEVNLAVAESLIQLGGASLEPLEGAFRECEDPSLRALMAVTHYFAAEASELSDSAPASVILNEVQSSPARAGEVARFVAWFSTRPNPLLSWFKHHPDAAVRKALAPLDLDEEVVRSRPELKAFYLEKTRDEQPEVSAAHLRLVSRYLPDS